MHLIFFVNVFRDKIEIWIRQQPVNVFVDYPNMMDETPIQILHSFICCKNLLGNPNFLKVMKGILISWALRMNAQQNFL